MSLNLEELEAVVARFRAGEAEVAARFFAEKRPLEQHLHWLFFQTAREARNLEEVANHDRCTMVDTVDWFEAYGAAPKPLSHTSIL